MRDYDAAGEDDSGGMPMTWESPIASYQPILFEGMDYYIRVLVDDEVQSWLLVKGGKPFSIQLTVDQPKLGMPINRTAPTKEAAVRHVPNE